jgi:CheY-like chemotaxis protein
VDLSEFNWKNEVILVADDDLHSSMILEKVFAKIGVQARFACNGLDALGIIKTDLSITLAIVDIRMPKLDGYELVEKAITIRPDIIYIAYTADVLWLNRKRCADIGFYTYILKPILPSVFVEILNEAFIARKRSY